MSIPASLSSKSPGPLLTVPEVAKVLRLSDNFVYRLVAEKKIPFIRVRRTVRFSASALASWLTKQEAVTPSEALGQRPAKKA